jgi:hypothetical protein
MATIRLQQCAQKPRVFIISDISNEPDDAESLCRYLLYANQFETEGLVACTSTWMKNEVHPEDMDKILDAYANAVPNLNQHVHPDWPYPSADHLRSLIRKGAEVCHPPKPSSRATCIANPTRPTACPPWAQTSPYPLALNPTAVDPLLGRHQHARASPAQNRRQVPARGLEAPALSHPRVRHLRPR